ncbi:MAG TPA: methylated-DNA--[protein]-cysteine S-methyltransferase [Vicinamibacterales bacterium]|jgi:methylated-DNA-[protein]-cysteine S-methyltransferase|nr:methylated-DNA--[protein]-cysteine S-methyltransferase [Vicinamibacterales bacterium]
MIRFDEIASPIGPLTIAERAGRLCLLHFGSLDDDVLTMFDRWYRREPRERRPVPAAAAALARYFAGDIHAIDDVAVELNGTPFQKDVWNALRRIPAGSTVSYATLATRIGQRTAVRAVGAANGANPVAIVVPCHRVIGSDGTLTGYGGGLERKQWLLSHEGVVDRRLF